jgi:hypothetical protein
MALSMAWVSTPDGYRVGELEMQSLVYQRDFDSEDYMVKD